MMFMPSRVSLVACGLLIVACAVSLPRPLSAGEPGPSAVERFKPIGGALVIAGGGVLPPEIYGKFLELGGGEQARVVVITTASIYAGTPEMDARMGFWREKKVASLHVMHTRSRDEANDPDFYRPLQDATAVWFIGGNQNWITDAYLGTRTEAQFREVLQRGGVLGGTSAGAAIMSRVMISGGQQTAHLRSGFGFAPGLIVDQHFRKRNRQNRLVDAVSHWPGHLGMGIDESTALVIRGGVAEVVGSSDVTITLGSAPGRPVKTESLSPGKTADLVALSRAALARRSPSLVQKPRRKHGTLMLVGQGDAPEEVRQQFLQAAGGANAPIVVVCSAEQADGEPEVCRWLRSAGASNVKALPARNREDAESKEFMAHLSTARGIWLSDGPIRRLIDTYVDTPAHAQLERLLENGGVVAGSASAAALQSAALHSVNQQDELEVLTESYERGFGFLPCVAVTSPEPQPSPATPLTGLRAKYPNFIGIELQHSTALVVRGDRMRVVGKHEIKVLDRRPSDDTDHPEFQCVKPGECYNLAERKIAASEDELGDQ